MLATLAASVDVKVIVVPSAVPVDQPTKGPPLNTPAVVGCASSTAVKSIPSVNSANKAATSVPVNASLAVKVKPATVTASPAFISLNVNTALSVVPSSLSAVVNVSAGKVRVAIIFAILPFAFAVNAKVAPDAVAVFVAQSTKVPEEKLPANVGFVVSATDVACAAVLPAVSPANAVATSFAVTAPVAVKVKPPTVTVSPSSMALKVTVLTSLISGVPATVTTVGVPATAVEVASISVALPTTEAVNSKSSPTAIPPAQPAKVPAVNVPAGRICDPFAAVKSVPSVKPSKAVASSAAVTAADAVNSKPPIVTVSPATKSLKVTVAVSNVPAVDAVVTVGVAMEAAAEGAKSVTSPVATDTKIASAPVEAGSTSQSVSVVPLKLPLAGLVPALNAAATSSAVIAAVAVSVMVSIVTVSPACNAVKVTVAFSLIASVPSVVSADGACVALLNIISSAGTAVTTGGGAKVPPSLTLTIRESPLEFRDTT